MDHFFALMVSANDFFAFQIGTRYVSEGKMPSPSTLLSHVW